MSMDSSTNMWIMCLNSRSSILKTQSMPFLNHGSNLERTIVVLLNEQVQIFNQL